MIALYGTDRAWRAALERQFRARGIGVRGASRPAELAKCLTDGAVVLVIVSDDGSAHIEAQRAAVSQRLLTTTPGEAMEDIVHRAMIVLESSAAQGA